MSPIFYVTLFLALCLCNASIDSGNQFNKAIDSNNVPPNVIFQINLIPNTSKKVKFKCLKRGRFIVAMGGSYKFAANMEERCEFIFEKLSASIQPRDSSDPRRLSYWLIQLNGLYLSSDNSTWVKKADWRY
ncbi:hypothetical protein Lal_00007704 [Lupinus albus]|nr:hypothetical protein Lal_00007704 [Lupinus albus]